MATAKYKHTCPYCGKKSRGVAACDSCWKKLSVIRKSGIWRKEKAWEAKQDE